MDTTGRLTLSLFLIQQDRGSSKRKFGHRVCAEKEDDVKIHSEKKAMGRLRQRLEQGCHKLRERQGLWAAPRSQERDQGQTIPQSLLLEEASPVHTLTLDSGLHNCERIHLHCFMLPSFCYFVTAATRK